MHDDCFRYEDVLQEERRRALMKTNALEKFNLTRKMKPFECTSGKPAEKIVDEPKPRKPSRSQKQRIIISPITINKLDVRKNAGNELAAGNQTFGPWQRPSLMRCHKSVTRRTGRNSRISDSEKYRNNSSSKQPAEPEEASSFLLCGTRKSSDYTTRAEIVLKHGMRTIRRVPATRKTERRHNTTFEMIGTKYVPPNEEKRRKKRMARVSAADESTHKSGRRNNASVIIQDARAELDDTGKETSIDDIFSPIVRRPHDFADGV